MYARKVLERRSLCIFAIFATACQASTGVSEACTDATCGASGTGASGTVLLELKSRNKRVNADDMQNDDGVQMVQEAATSTSTAARMEALANLAYDSDDGTDISPELDLEFNDDDSAEDRFHQYVKSKDYSEESDVNYNPDVWNSAPEVRASHNCYMYALNDLSPWSASRCRETQSLLQEGKLVVEKGKKKTPTPKICKRYFHKPGYYFQNIRSGRQATDVWFRDETTCHLMLPMLAADSPAIVWKNEKNETLREEDSCPEKHYMAALFIAPKAGFHFYRRDHVCPDDKGKLCWSHKPGILEAQTEDASGKRIYSTLQADRNYGELNYTEHCAFFCVPQNSRARTHSDSRKVLGINK